MKLRVSFILVLLCVACSLNGVCGDVYTMLRDTVPAEKKKDTTYWSHLIKTNLTFSQTAYSYWAAGGNSSLSGVASIDASLNYQRDIISLKNSLNLGYGYMLIADVAAPSRKTDDKLNFYSQLNYKWYDWIAYSLLLDFKTQFTNGYKYPNDSVVVSHFFAPAYLTLSFGVDITPIKPLSLFVSPISGKFTFVNDELLANAGAFGVTAAVFDADGNVITPGLRFRSEVGFNFVAKYSQVIAKKITATSKFELHNNYLDENEANRWNFDIDWETKLIFAITKHFTTNFYLRMIYDDDIKFPIYDEVDGVQVVIKEVPKLQLNENFGLGFMFTF
ncbi:MAG: DUF3078 domain-containing protein [Bacteroidales bacterium]|nr:DUF3078 domain-containing protein [Bacteroidales bacterium]